VLESVGGTPLDPPVTVLSGEAGLHRILEESHAVVLSVPETPKTRGMIGRDALARMRSDAILVNVGRGGLVDTEALVEALREGGIRGAALDVAEEEPLPDDHPLWTVGPVLVTPHVSGVTDAFWERETDLIVENVERWQAGRPLRNRVRPERGY
jgi:phosphoglycerate dehydrogenase-like enzyme